MYLELKRKTKEKKTEREKHMNCQLLGEMAGGWEGGPGTLHSTSSNAISCGQVGFESSHELNVPALGMLVLGCL